MANDFTIRVYAILKNEKDEILLLNESYLGVRFTKFPGGGLQWGEGPKDTLKRELLEELDIENIELDLFYTTDFFVSSYFDTNVQVISVYYIAKNKIESSSICLSTEDENLLGMKWVPATELKPGHVTFPIDKKVVELFRKNAD